MPRFDPSEFGRMLARLTPHELRQAEGLVAEARERTEALVEIDARAEAEGPVAACPHCGGGERVRVGADTGLCAAMALLRLRGDFVGPEQHAARPGASAR